MPQLPIKAIELKETWEREREEGKNKESVRGKRGQDVKRVSMGEKNEKGKKNNRACQRQCQKGNKSDFLTPKERIERGLLLV